MRYLIAFLAMCGTASAQEFSVSVQQYRIVDGVFIETDEPQPPLSEKYVNPPDAGQYLVAFVGTHCQPCHTWQERELPKLQAAGISVTIHNIDHSPVDRIRLVPSFEWCDRATKTVISSTTGYTSSSTLMGMNVKQSKRVERAAEKLERVVARTAEELSAADHLRNVHGINPDGMTMAQMERAHDRAHSGMDDSPTYHFPNQPSRSSAIVQSPVRIISRGSSCPSGNCPTRRVGPFGLIRWRR